VSSDELRLRNLLDVAPVAVVEIDRSGRVAFANAAAGAMTGRPAEELVGASLVELVDEADRAALAAAVAREDGPRGEAVDVRFTRADGAELWAAVAIGGGWLGEAPRVATWTDVTERKRFERAQSDRADRLDAFMQAGPVVAWMKDARGAYVYVNAAAAATQGAPAHDLVGHTAAELLAPDVAALVARQEAELHEARAAAAVVELDVASGGRRTFQLVRFLFWDTAGAPFTGGIGVDVTAQRAAEEALRQTQEQLRHAQKLDALGRLAGGVAHDFNNVLTVILSYTSLLLERGDLPASAREDLGDVAAAGARAAALTRRLLSFSRAQVLEPRVVDLNEILLGARGLLERLVGEEVDVRLACAPDVGRVVADEAGIAQVLMNLAVNARDAMPSGGTLTFETEDVELASPKRGAYVRLIARDTGAGMDETTRARVFEPFFTTKDVGKGTGLGLSTVVGVVEQLGGTISVESSPGAGSAFVIHLPRTERPLDEPPPTRPIVRRRGAETVLVVEDEPAVRALVVEVLRDAGYHALAAASPAEALALSAREVGRPIHLLLADVVMPGMSGVELWDMLRRERRDLRVLWMSGHTDESVRRHGLDRSMQLFLQKPFTPETLTSRVGDVLA
jgi:PAS domain S-box-containing protein